LSKIYAFHQYLVFYLRYRFVSLLKTYVMTTTNLKHRGLKFFSLFFVFILSIAISCSPDADVLVDELGLPLDEEVEEDSGSSDGQSGDESGGDTTGGDTTGGDETGGDETGGDETIFQKIGL